MDLMFFCLHCKCETLYSNEGTFCFTCQQPYLCRECFTYKTEHDQNSQYRKQHFQENHFSIDIK